MPVEPAMKIYSVPNIKRQESVSLSQKKKQKPEKGKKENESGKIDIKV